MYSGKCDRLSRVRVPARSTAGMTRASPDPCAPLPRPRSRHRRGSPQRRPLAWRGVLAVSLYRSPRWSPRSALLSERCALRSLFASTVDNRSVLLLDHHLLGAPEHVHSDLVEFNAKILTDRLTASQDSDDSSMALRRSPKPGAFTATTLSPPRSLLTTSVAMPPPQHPRPP